MRKSPQELTVRDVVREAGVSPGAFYKCFPDKDSLLTTVVEEIIIPFRIIVRSIRNTSTTAREFLELSLRSGSNLMRDTEELNHMTVQSQYSFRRYAYMPHIVGPCLSDVQEDLENGIKSGKFKEHDTEAFALIYLSIIMDMFVQSAVFPEDVEEAVSFHIEFMASMIEPDENAEC